MKEEALQRQVADYLDRHLPDGALWWHTPNGGHRNKAVAAKLKAQGVKRGVPDVIILWQGSALFIELKTPTGALSKEQREWRDSLGNEGFDWGLCRSLESVADFLALYGVPMKARPK